ncbi:hypothetical protein HZS_604 [Henneguya salminicola]|nr:hypothetical protein HZS_604 [Henneguya salminicola]
MYIHVVITISLTIFYSTGASYVLAPSISTVRKDRRIFSEFYHENSLNIKLSPIFYHSFFDALARPFEIIIPIFIERNSKINGTMELLINLVEENPITGVRSQMSFVEKRTISSTRKSFESITLPPLNISKITRMYLNVNILLVIEYLEYFDQLVPSYKNVRNDARDISLFLPCRRSSLRLNFQDIGWSSWIILPKSLNIFQCLGSCNYYNSFHTDITDNAVARALMKTTKDIMDPCCIPLKFNSVTVLTKSKLQIEDKRFDSLVNGKSWLWMFSCG